MPSAPCRGALLLAAAAWPPLAGCEGAPPAASTVALRVHDGFTLGRPSQWDFENVAFEAGRLLLFAGSEDGKRNIETLLERENFTNDSRYLEGPQPLDGPPVVVHPTAFPEQGYCRTTFDGVVHWLVPWFHNLYHLHATNIYPKAAELLTDPTCGPKVELPCRAGPRRRIYMLKAPRSHSIKHVEVLKILFGDDVRSAPELLSGGPHCLSRMAWGGSGPNMLNILGKDSRFHVREGIAVASAVRTAVLDHYGIWDRDRGTTESMALAQVLARQPAQAVHVSRAPWLSPGHAPRRGRFIANDQPIRAAFKRRGVEMRTCCNFDADSLADMARAFADADVVLGMHGAGLANALYARRGAVIVELLHGHGSGSDFYRRLALLREGAIVSMHLGASPSNEISADEAEELARCAVAAWRSVGPTPAVESACGAAFDKGRADLHRTELDLRPRAVPEANVSGGPLPFELAPCSHSGKCPEDMRRRMEELLSRAPKPVNLEVPPARAGAWPKPGPARAKPGAAAPPRGLEL